MTVLTEGELLVGIEIHQQLACATKLFCACPPAKSEEFPHRFERRLRPAQSETGKLDPAAVFEYSRGRSNTYFWSPESSCLVEADEEPPHRMSEEALDAALLIGTTLGSTLVDEVHVMRKIVIDGSNTGGFQRTAVVGLGGTLEVDGTDVGVQSVTIEEDAARILGEDAGSRSFALDRLGVALVEIALDPVRGDPEFVGRVALRLGRVLRSTGRVARGLGTIRQDLNVSLAGGGVVEVKGVQKLNLLPRVVEYELRRQRMLLAVAARLREGGAAKVTCSTREVSRVFEGAASGIIGDTLAGGGRVVCVAATGLGGLLGWEPEPGVRLGKELAEVARANSVGGVIHSDEFERQGISQREVEALQKETGAGRGDGLVLVAGPPKALERVVPLLEARLAEAPRGVPAETRAATDSGETRYMRPRPGSQRMYPETDIPTIRVPKALLKELSKSVPEGWEERVARLAGEFSLSGDMAIKIYDSDLEEAFRALCKELNLEPSLIASTLVDLPQRLSREGVSEGGLSPAVLGDFLRAVDRGEVAKEAAPEVLRAVGATGSTVSEAVRSLGLSAAGEAEVRSVVGSVVRERSKFVEEKGASAFSALMGEAMKKLRGRADGAVVGRILREELERELSGPR